MHTNLRVDRFRPLAIQLTLLTCAVFGLLGSAAAQQPPQHAHLPQAGENIVTHRIYAENDAVYLLLKIPIPGKRITETHKVQVPVVVNGVGRLRTEERTRSIPATREKRVAAKGLVTFCDLQGNKLDAEAVAKRVPPTGAVVVLSRSSKISDDWRAVLKPDTIVMLQIPRP